MMVKVFPEAQYILRRTYGKRESFHGWHENQLCLVATVNVFFLNPELLSHIDQDDGEMVVTDHGKYDRREIQARLQYAGSDPIHIQRELNHPEVGSSCYKKHFLGLEDRLTSHG